MASAQPKPVVWMGQSRRSIRKFPVNVRSEIGFALYEAQLGAKHVSAKPLRGFGGATVLEIVEDDDGSTYRCVYTVKFPEAVYVLHAFQKKSTKGIATPQHDVNLIKERLAAARQLHEEWKREQARSKKG